MSAQAGSGSGLTIHTREYADCRVATVEGRIDHTTSEEFLSSLTAQAGRVGTGALVVDMGALAFITSAGLRALVIAHRTLREAGGRLIVADLRGVVAEVFRIAKFDTLIEVADSVEDALARHSEAARAAWAG